MADKPVGSSEETLIAVRRGKAEKLRARGQNPFANDVDVTGRMSVQAVRARCSSALLEPQAALKYDPAQSRIS